MKTEELLLLKDQLSSLANSTDPKSGLLVEDTILMSTFNRLILEKAVDVIDRLLILGINPFDYRLPGKRTMFFLTEEEKKSISLSEKPISVSAFTHVINSAIDTEKKKPLQAVQITSWLMSIGFLDELEDEDGRKFKVNTPRSSEIGISSEKRQSSCGREYRVNLYNRDAQAFILDNMDEIIRYR